ACLLAVFYFFFKQKTAYEVSRDWSSDVCSSDLEGARGSRQRGGEGGLGDLAVVLDHEDMARGELAHLLRLKVENRHERRAFGGRSEERRVGNEKAAQWVGEH